MNLESTPLDDLFHAHRPKPSKGRYICIACDGPAPGIRVIVHTIICKRCMESAVFDLLRKCFWCREEKLCHRFSHPAFPGGGILLMCQDCRDDFLRRIEKSQENKRTRQILCQGNLMEVTTA